MLSDTSDADNRFFEPLSWIINLNGIAVRTEDDDEISVFEGVQPVILDSSNPLCGLPGSMHAELVAAFPSAIFDSSNNLYSVECELADIEGSVDFTFENVVIDVPYSDFIWRNPLNEVCYLGVYQDSCKTSRLYSHHDDRQSQDC